MNLEIEYVFIGYCWTLLYYDVGSVCSMLDAWIYMCTIINVIIYIIVI